MVLTLALFTLTAGFLQAQPPAPAHFRPLEERIYITPGQRTLIIPIHTPSSGRGGAVPLRSSSSPDASAPATALWVGIDTSERSTASSGLRDWIGRPGRWYTADAPPDAAAAGFWVVQVDLTNTPTGTSLFSGDERLPIVWLDAPSLDGNELLKGVAAALIPPTADRARLLAMLEPALQWPIERWRAAALSAAAHPASASSAGVVRLAHPADPALDALAVQVELRWRCALARLAQSDPSLARRLAGRLMAVCDFGDSVAAPVWPGENSGTGLLLDALLDPRMEAADCAGAARSFLMRLPDAVAWVVDDAGADPARAVIACVSLDPRAASVEFSASATLPAPPAPVLLPLLAVQRIEVSLVAPAPAADLATRITAATRGGEITYLVSAGPRRLRILDRTWPVAPPGLDIGPLLAEWNMASWTAGIPRTPAAVLPPPVGSVPLASDWLTAARLLRQDDGQWLLYVECACGPRAAADSDSLLGESLTIWLGSADAPAAAFQITPDGRMIDRRRPATPAQVRINRSDPAAPGWIAWVPIPDSAIDRSGLLRIAIERTDARGVRSSWPRPVFPWQEQPGRLLLDLSAWSPAP